MAEEKAVLAKYLYMPCQAGEIRDGLRSVAHQQGRDALDDSRQRQLNVQL